MSYSKSDTIPAPLSVATGLDVAVSIHREVLALFDRYERPLLRYAWAQGLSAGDAEDVVQDAFVALFQHLGRGRSRQNLPGWLFQVVHYLAIKRRWRARRQDLWFAGASSPEPFGPDADPEALMLEAERRRRWRSVLRAMPDRDRRCLLLRAEGLRYRDIANALGISLGSVAKSVARGMTKLLNADRV